MTAGKGEAGAGAQRRRSRILVVDDEPDLREALHDLLAAAIDADVVTAASGKQALALAQKEPFDLVMSDYKMPEMDGLELLARLSREAPDVPRVMITAYPDQNLAIQAINEAKIETFLTKPLDPSQVVRVTRDLLEKRRQHHQRNAAFLEAIRPGGNVTEEARAWLEAQCIKPLEVAIATPGIEAAALVGRDGVAVCARSTGAFDLDTASSMGAASFAAAEVAARALGETAVTRLHIETANHRAVVTALGDEHLFLILAEPGLAASKLEQAIEALAEPLQLLLVGT